MRAACVDDDAQGERADLLWEHELDAAVLAGGGWDRVAARGFDDPQIFAACQRTLRWGMVTATEPGLLQAPFRAGIRLDAYQLEPLRKALLLPRVNLLIADDVGLGKTIEAGLIVRELLYRRRIDLVVVACPPSTLPQWQDELETRFGLRFTIVDRAFYAATRRERGFAQNPWRTASLLLVSSRLLVDDTYASGLAEMLGELRPRSLLVLGFAVHQGREVFAELARRMAACPRLAVRLCLDVPRQPADTSTEAAILADEQAPGVLDQDDVVRQGLGRLLGADAHVGHQERQPAAGVLHDRGAPLGAVTGRAGRRSSAASRTTPGPRPGPALTLLPRRPAELVRLGGRRVRSRPA